MEVNTMKTVAVLTVIFGCFGVLYPKIFHPMLMQFVGVYPEPNDEQELATGKHVPPHLRKPGMQGTSRPIPSPQDDTMRHMRHGGPHPGMRAAAEMQKQAGTTSGRGGGGGGMMTIVLPMYAIGIVLYLVYTLSKVLGGKKKTPEDDALITRHFNNSTNKVRYSAEHQKFIYGDRDSNDEQDDAEYSYRQNKRKQKDLDRLLFKADKDKISDLEMRELKKRLLETEAQMTRILHAMDTVSDTVTEHTLAEDGNENTPNDGMSDMYREYEQQGATPGPYDNSGYTNQYENSGECDDQRGDAREETEMTYDENDVGNAEYYDDDFENSNSEIEENIEMESESGGEEMYGTEARQEGDNQEGGNFDAEFVKSGKFDGEFTDSESGNSNIGDFPENESETYDGEFSENESESEGCIDSQKQNIQSDLRKRTVKSEPHNNED